MKVVAEKLVKEVNELKGLCAKTMLSDPDTLQYLDDDNIALIIKSLCFMDTATDFIMEEAKIIDEMNEKLNTLLLRCQD